MLKIMTLSATIGPPLHFLTNAMREGHWLVRRAFARHGMSVTGKLLVGHRMIIESV
jgi:hypothetical protein